MQVFISGRKLKKESMNKNCEIFWGGETWPSWTEVIPVKAPLKQKQKVVVKKLKHAKLKTLNSLESRQSQQKHKIPTERSVLDSNVHMEVHHSEDHQLEDAEWICRPHHSNTQR